MTLIRACDLALGYDGKTVAENINFTVNEGDYLCVIGENGSGKSTLIKNLLGLNKPVSGSLETALDLKKIGYLPQQTEVQRDFPATVGEIVMSGFAGKCGYRPFYSAAQRADALLNMRKMGIESLVKRGYAARFAPPKVFYCLMNPRRGLTPRRRRICIDLYQNLTETA